MALTRFAAQQLYAPDRLLRALEGVYRVPIPDRGPVPLIRTAGTLAEVEATPLASWADETGLYVTAVRLRNRTHARGRPRSAHGAPWRVARRDLPPRAALPGGPRGGHDRRLSRLGPAIRGRTGCLCKTALMETRANPIPFILAGVLVLMAVLVGFKGCAGEDPSTTQGSMQRIPEAPPADADTPADTIRTLRAGVADMTNKFTAMSEENRRLLDQNEKLERKLTELQGQVEGREARELRADSALQGLSRRIEELSGGLRSLRDRGPSPPIRTAGLTGNPEALVWIEPVGLPMGLAAAQAGPKPDAAKKEEKQKPPPRPAYTIAENMALAGSTAFTALVGRIPIRGTVQDPFPFYVLVGAENLAANGLELPEVAGVIFRGTALGDWNLSCVRGRLLSATFVFRNGTIRTVRGNEQEPLGELADEFGCRVCRGSASPMRPPICPSASWSRRSVPPAMPPRAPRRPTRSPA